MKYNQKNVLNQSSLTIGRVLLIVLATALMNTSSQAQSISDYSALPETFISPPDQTPNILLVFDNSTSMTFDVSGSRVGGHLSTSRSYQVRQAVRSLLTNNVGKYNIGLMTFGGEGRDFELTADVSACNDYIGCTSPATFGVRDLTGTGYLLENLESLTTAKKDRINALLATEPIAPTLSDPNDVNAPYDLNRVYFTDSNASIVQLGVMTSGNGTPLTGTLETAKRYLVDGAVNRGESIFFNSATGPDTTTYPVFTNGVLTECRPNTYVFLITDGSPTVNNSGDSVASIANEVVQTTAAATALYTSGVETFVFGFAVTNTEEGYMNLIARGGSGGALGRDAFISNSSAQLEADIAAALTEVAVRAGSASGVSIVSSSSDTAGSVVQAIYNPTLTGFKNNADGSAGTTEVTVSWTSTLRAFFLDEYGYLREDSQSSGTQGKLDDYTIDKAFELRLEDVDTDGDGLTDAEELRATRFNITGIGTLSFSENPETTKVEIDDLEAIWEAGDVMGKHYAPNSTDAARTATGAIYGQQDRPYNQIASNANGYRKIYSWLQTDPSSDTFDSGTQLDFVFDDSGSPAAGTFNANNFSLLDVATADEARQVIEYIRGNDYVTTEVAGVETPVDLRNRTIAGESFILGDIVHSTAAQVDTPNALFNSQFNDDSYTGFRETYEFRRRVIYVGGNDGLLHAFNGGFWDGENAQLNLTPNDGSIDVAHELGAELWAYAPMNLLPHLKWLSSTSYNTGVHVAYVDGPVQTFDIKAFDEDPVHVNGWGTVLVVGMRLGGGEYPNVDIDANSGTANSFTTRSAYIVIDITDPSQEPEVIGEITHPDLGFTTGVPTIMKEGDDWYLVFGSGPNDVTTASSVGVTDINGVTTDDREAKFFRYKLNEGDRGFDAASPINIPTSGEVNSFTGDMISQDWNSDYSDDAVYFGVSEGGELSPSGALYRYVATDARTAASGIELLVDVNQPVLEKPLLRSGSGKNWVLFGTGRYLTSNDVKDTAQNSFYGVMEPRGTYSSVALGSLLDITGVTVEADTIDNNGDVTASGGDLTPPVDGQATFGELRAHILSDASVNGWKYRFPLGPPSSKNTTPAVSFRNNVFYTYFTPPVPDGDQCSGEFGTSYVNAVDIITGTARYVPGFSGTFGTDGSGNLTQTVEFGKGAATGFDILVVKDPTGAGGPKLSLRGGTDAGEVPDVDAAIAPRPNGRTSWRELEVQ